MAINGAGQVQRPGNDILEFSYLIPETTIGRTTIPRSQGAIQLEYMQIVDGNRGLISLNGKDFRDNNINISSRTYPAQPNRNRRKINPSVKLSGKKIVFTLRRRSGSSAEIVRISGHFLLPGTRIRLTKPKRAFTGS